MKCSVCARRIFNLFETMHSNEKKPFHKTRKNFFHSIQTHSDAIFLLLNKNVVSEQEFESLTISTNKIKKDSQGVEILCEIVIAMKKHYYYCWSFDTSFDPFQINFTLQCTCTA